MILIFTPRSFASYNASAISPVVKIKTATSIDFSEKFIVFIMVFLIRPLGEKKTFVFACSMLVARSVIKTQMHKDRKGMIESIFCII
jgi:hypothetical protein